MDVSQLALALGSSLAAGLNLYITILTLGLAQRFEVLHLPADLQILANTWVLVTAGLLLVVEFFADKIPYLDNTWDAIHTFIRVPAGALLAAGALGQLSQQWIWVAALLGGFVSFSSHGAKASTRLAVNASPEPFSNWILSFGEDAVSLGVLWLASSHPYLAIGVVVVAVGVCLTILFVFFRFLKLLFRRRRAPSPA
ncbi:MAG: DUF4126 domain-containing protein [Acidobacteriota bacterium]|jgi:hypothetical protein